MPPGKPSSQEPAGDMTSAMALAVFSLLASMTAWEPLSAREAERRVHATAEAVGLSSFLENGSIRMPSALEPGSLEMALRTLRAGNGPFREWVLRAALDLALGSGTLPLAQNLSLRMVAEALRLPVDSLPKYFRLKTGAELPELWDPSDPAAWTERGTRKKQESLSRAGTDWDDAGAYPTTPPGAKPSETDNPRIARIKSLALLGLEEGATMDEVKQAYRRISRVHHPDHYAQLGSEAMSEATQAFQRIKAAYDFLMDGTNP